MPSLDHGHHLILKILATTRRARCVKTSSGSKSDTQPTTMEMRMTVSVAMKDIRACGGCEWVRNASGYDLID